MAGLRKGRRKEFGRTRARVRGRNKQVFLSFFSRDRIENPFPFRKTVMRTKEKTANVWNHQVRAFLLRNYVNMFRCFTPSQTLLFCKKHRWHMQIYASNEACAFCAMDDIREVDVAGRWRRHNQVTQIQKIYFIVYYIVFLLSCIFLILTFLTVTLPPKLSFFIDLWDEVNSGEIRQSVRRFGQWSTRHSG